MGALTNTCLQYIISIQNEIYRVITRALSGINLGGGK